MWKCQWFQRDLIMCFWKQLKIIPFPSGFYFFLLHLFHKRSALLLLSTRWRSAITRKERRNAKFGEELMFSTVLSGLMTQTITAKLIANLPLEPRSLISPSDDDDVTFVTTGSAPGFLCGASDKHPATPAVFLPSVSLIDHLCKCLKVEPLTSRHLAQFSSRLPPTPSLTGGSEKTVKSQTQTIGVRRINVTGRKTSRCFH